MALIMASYRARALDPKKSIAQYAHEVWGTKSGLPEADVMAILQTRDGYLWVGTEEGVARFDGAQFTVFDRKNTPLPNNRVQALTESPDGSLWIGTENGLTRLKDRRFTNYGTRDGLPSSNIRALWAQPGGPLWVTTVAGVRLWRRHSFERDPELEKIAGSDLRQFLRAPDGETWIASDTGLTVTSGGSAARTSLHGKVVRVLLEDSRGQLWIGTTAGLYRLVKGRLSDYSLPGHAAHPEITALLEDRDHNLWVGTLDEGLLRINQDGIQRYSVADGLSGVEVKSLYEDSTGILWVGTFGGGLDEFRDTMITPYGKQEGLSADVAWTVMEGPDSSIWIGTQSGGLDRLQHNKVTVYSTREGFADNTVGSLFEGGDGTLWLGKDSGLSRFVDGRVIGQPPASPVLHEQVHTIYQDGNGTLWIGTRSSGLVRLRGEKYTYFSTRDGLANNNIQAIIPSRDGGLWIGTLGGLSHYRNGKFVNLTKKDGLSADQVVSLYEDAQGTLWIGTDGVNRLKNGKITAYGASEGLFDQNPLAIVEDNNGYLWLSTNKGIFRVLKQQLNDFADGKTEHLTPVEFGTEDGMRNAECDGGSTPSAWRDRSGNLWFPTVAGVVRINPQPSGASPPLQLHIEDMWMDNRHIAPAGSLRLPPGGHEVEFHYSAPYFAGAARLHYKYRLEGFDKDWVNAGSRTTAYYTNLPPGSYDFRVVATVLDATQGQAQAALSFYLTPHFYQTRIFNVLVVLAFFGLVSLTWIWTYRLMIARQNELRRLVKARTRELEGEKAELLEAKAALAQQASHDSLTGLMNRAAIIRVLEEEMRQAEREGGALAVILTDLDHFKEVNDGYGHLLGDEVLREFARRLNHNLRPYDHAGRFGGEEFLIVMPGLSVGSSNRVWDLHHELTERPFVQSDLELRIACSIGVAWFHPEIRKIESLLNLADQALYTAKAKGRNRVETTLDVLPSHPPRRGV